MGQGILVMLAASIGIGLLESFVFSIWCAGRQLRFSSKALLAVLLGAGLGSVGGLMGSGGDRWAGPGTIDAVFDQCVL
jgi:hypothetical protein